MSGSTWTWIGGSINVDSPGDWELTSGPGNVTGIPEAGDTAINDGILVGVGVIAAAVINNGTIEASNNSITSASTGGDLEIQGAVSGTGSMTIEPGATLQPGGALGAAQAIAFTAGPTEALILGAPDATIANPITGFAAADRIDFANGVTINPNSAALLNGNTLAVTYHNAAGSIGVYDLTNVTFAANTTTPLSFLTGYDYLNNDEYVIPTTFLSWVGTSSTNFGTAANWNLGSIVPSVANYVNFNNGIGGSISGSGTVEGFNFVNTGDWVLAAGASISFAIELNIGLAGGGTNSTGDLTVGSGSTLTSPGGNLSIAGSPGDVGTLTVSGGGVVQETAGDYDTAYIVEVGPAAPSGTLAAASGSLVVTGIGSFMDLPFNGIVLGENGGNGSMIVSQGGSVLATSPNSNLTDSVAIGRTGNGTLTVTDPGSEVTAAGYAYIAHVQTGTLTVENFGTFLATSDQLGLAGLFIGDGNANGQGGTGNATVTTDGLLDSQGFVIVGYHGTSGQLTVVNGGTVQAGTTLSVGDGGTIASGPTAAQTGNGTLTIGAGSTVELTGTAQTTSYGVYLADSNDGTVSTEEATATVSGTGALLNANGNGIAVGEYGTATLTVSQGGSVASGTANSTLISALSIGRQGNGTVTVTDPGSHLTADGDAILGKGGEGSLIVENQGSVLIGLDLLGAGGLDIGGGGTNSTGSLFVGGTGTALVTSDGDLLSQANIDVGKDGSSGTLTVTAGGTAEAAEQLLIGQTTTVTSGAIIISSTGTTTVTTPTVENGVGVVTVGAGGVLKVDGTNIASSGTADIVVGDGAGSTATLNVSGAGATVNAGGFHTDVGYLGQGNVLVSQGGTLLTGTEFASDAALNIGVEAGISGAVTVTGLGSSIAATGQINVGLSGSGSLTVENEATVESGNSTLAPSQGIDVGQQTGATGTIAVTGPDSLLENTGEFIVGDAGLGGLGIGAGGTVTTSAAATIANTASASDSSANVSGGGSKFEVAGALTVGDAGFGSLSVSQSATVTAASVSEATAAGGDGVITVEGSNSALALTGSLTVGSQGAGEVDILGGGTVTALDLTIGNANALSSGNVDVEGAGSTLNILTGGILNIGVAHGGSGILTIGTGATLSFAGTVVEAGQASYNNNGGFIDPDAVQFTSDSNSGGGVNQYDLYVENLGAVQITGDTGTWDTPMLLTGTSVADAVNNISGGSLGQWQLGGGGTLVINANTVDAGQAVVFEDAGDTLVIGQLVNGGADGVSGQTPSVLGGAENLLQAGGFQAAIWGYQAGDQILFDNLAVTSDQIVNGNTLELLGSGNTDLGSLTFFTKAGNKALGVTAMAAAAAQMACFAAGTLIETPDGPRPVETLAVGDAVVTLLGGPGRIVWVGSRAVDCKRHPRPETVWPVRIAAGAFGANVPVRDLWVSPDHAIYVDDVLIPAKHLVNGTTVCQVQQHRVVYHHVELERHDVVLAEGLPAETYLDTGDRAKFSGAAVLALHPDFSVRVLEALACAPVVVTGPQLATVRTSIDGRAAEMPRHTAAAALDAVP